MSEIDPRNIKESLKNAAYAAKLLRLHEERARQTGPGGLMHFIRYFWKVLEPGREFTDGWVLHAIAEHLEAVQRGEITRLLINVPPGCMKSLMSNCFFPAWCWGPMGMAHTRWLSFSYSAHLTERDNNKFRTLISSKPYQELWGDVFKLTGDAKIQVSNDKMGWKLASSVGGVVTGERGDFIIADDLHQVSQGESERVRTETVRWFKESMSNRVNDPDRSVIIVIMQRVHGSDVSGTIMEDKEGMNYHRLCIPMRFDPGHPYPTITGINWEDPRTEDGELAWPERFSARRVDDYERELGPYAFSAQYQQNPAPRGGGIIKQHWIRTWENAQNKFPAFSYVIAALDPAYTEKHENDPSGFSVWGIFRHPESNEPGIMLVNAWRKWLQLHGDNSPKFPGETHAAYARRCGDGWGLVEWIAHSCDAYGVSHLLIEGKASGISVYQEIERLQMLRTWSTELCDTGRLDKMARMNAVQPIFSQGLVWMPDRDWANDMMEELLQFPKYKFDDMADTCSLALRKLREMGLLQFQDEREFDEYIEQNRAPVTQALYPV